MYRYTTSFLSVFLCESVHLFCKSLCLPRVCGSHRSGASEVQVSSICILTLEVPVSHWLYRVGIISSPFRKCPQKHFQQTWNWFCWGETWAGFPWQKKKRKIKNWEGYVFPYVLPHDLKQTHPIISKPCSSHSAPIGWNSILKWVLPCSSFLSSFLSFFWFVQFILFYY